MADCVNDESVCETVSCVRNCHAGVVRVCVRNCPHAGVVDECVFETVTLVLYLNVVPLEFGGSPDTEAAPDPGVLPDRQSATKS